jgi:acyl-CoA reductase-like NAD-dependent aldehyde dehydrogenase
VSIDSTRQHNLTFSFNHGQTCCAGSRIYVQRSIYDKFAAGFKAQTEKLKVGDPFSPDSYQGPQVSQVQCDRIMGYVESGKQEGAKVIAGGKRHGKDGYFIEPVSSSRLNTSTGADRRPSLETLPPT